MAQTATSALMDRCEEIDELLARIAAARADHFGARPDAVDWGHVGTADHLVSRLRELAEFVAPVAA